MQDTLEAPSYTTNPAETLTQIAVAYGDGIGPEIMTSTLNVLKAAGAKIDCHPVEIGEAVYNKGFTSGIEPSSWDTIRSTGVFLKAPISTPQGGGFKSLNVTVRKTLGLFANVRPCIAYSPYVKTMHPAMDIVVIRENEEDLYAGIEHRQTDEVYQCLKLVSRPGCERLIRHAFEYARANGRKKVTCMTKDNIMKLPDGLFHKVFDEIGAEYPELQQEHMIIDIGMARAANRPEEFDVIVTMNLYGDILSDVTAEIAGSVGMSPSSNIGEPCAMFEAIHGSAPGLGGSDTANPSGLLLAGVMMLVHIGQAETAARVHNAWLRTIEDGIHTKDIYQEGISKRLAGTQEFAESVIARLGQEPQVLRPVSYSNAPKATLPSTDKAVPAQKKELVGIDIFVQWTGSPTDLAERLKTAEARDLKLQMITNRGIKVWPGGFPETFHTDHWRCRFISEPCKQITPDQVLELMGGIYAANLDFIKAETLCLFDGQPGFSLGQGQ